MTLYPDSSLTFLVVRDLHATGLGKVGQVARKCNMYVYSPKRSYDAEFPFYVHFTSEKFSTKKTQAELALRREESSETWHQVMADGLRRAHHAGMTELKRRK